MFVIVATVPGHCLPLTLGPVQEIEDVQNVCYIIAKEWALNTGKLPEEGLPRNSVLKQVNN